ncbi:MAG TPA: EAL domain-containing protein [Thermoanaerobaculia bacterium]|nr:EAL domain-containing protein [Thermoanaerobaculia bacterium]
MPELDDSANLRAEWLQYRARLFDREIGLPTLPTIVDDVKRQLEDGGSIGLLTFILNAERQVEEIWGWQAYDKLIGEFVKSLRTLAEGGLIPQGTFCLPAIRSDEVLCFLPVANRDGAQTPPDVWLSALAAELDDFVRAFLTEKLNTIDRYCSRVGQAIILFDPKVRVERVVYRGLREARESVYQRTKSAEEHGAEVLKGILSRKDIVSVFQPIYDLVERKIAAVEALSRGPAGSGFEDAEALFSLSERVGLVIPLERLCRRRSLEEAGKQRWPRQIFVNMSPAAASDHEFLEGAFLRDVEEVHLDPRQIVIEVTERTYAQHKELFERVLKELRREGFRVAVDDLGSGYSNLSSLAEIKPEFLKFDHLFTKEIHRHRIKQDLLGAILSFAIELDTQVIAEGIETQEEFEALRRLGVPLGQGYFLAKPGKLVDFRLDG